MGRFGPAFLVYPNFQVYLQWNNSLVYSPRPRIWRPASPAQRRFTTATRRRRCPFDQVKELQTLLVRAGYDVGKIDGFLGLK